MATAGTDAASSATPSPIFASPTEAGLASAELLTPVLSGTEPANPVGASTSMSAVGWDSTYGDGKVADGDETSVPLGGIGTKMELLQVVEESFQACSADGEKADAEHMGDTEDELESRSDEEYLSPPPPPIEMEDEDVGDALLAYTRSHVAPTEQAEHLLPAMSSSPPTPVRSAKRSAGLPLRRELASLYESSSLVSGSNGTHRPGMISFTCCMIKI